MDSTIISLIIPACDACHTDTRVEAQMVFHGGEIQLLEFTEIEEWRCVSATRAAIGMQKLFDRLTIHVVAWLRDFKDLGNETLGYERIVLDLEKFIRACEKYPQGTVWEETIMKESYFEKHGEHTSSEYASLSEEEYFWAYEYNAYWDRGGRRRNP